MIPPSALPGRLYVAAAAILWSLSGLFVKLLTKDNVTGLGDPPVPGLLLAFYRCLFAGLAILPFTRRADITFRPLMPLMMLTFAVMNGLYVSAMASGSAANAVVLQYTAPLWVFLVGVLVLKEKADRRDPVAMTVAMLGVGVIVACAGVDASSSDLLTVVIALGSGVAYAGVILCLRALRAVSPQWLTVLNNLAAAFCLLPLVIALPSPRLAQMLVLVLFGAVQMGLPYWLMSRGLRSISSQEAAMICLLEPLLNPLWAYLVAGEVPGPATLIGGGLILAALAYRYAPKIGRA